MPSNGNHKRGMRHINQKRKNTMTTATITLTTETATAISQAINASVSADKATAKCNEKTRDALTRVYNEVTPCENGKAPVYTEQTFKDARAIILEECKKVKSWPISEKTDEKVGYQAAMKAGCSSAIWYNKAQALLQLDLKAFKKAEQEQADIQHILDTDPDTIKTEKTEQAEKARNEKIAQAFHNFIKHFEDLSQADKTFQELMKTAKTAKTA